MYINSDQGSISGDGVQNSPDFGRTADLGQAQEISDLGNPVKEQETGKEVGGELSELQKRNLEVMDGLEKMYPKAFEKIVDEKGREVLVANAYDIDKALPLDGGSPIGNSMLFTRDSVLKMEVSMFNKCNNEVIQLNWMKNMDWKHFNDVIESRLKVGSNFDFGGVCTENSAYAITAKGKFFDYGDRGLDSITLNMAQSIGEKKSEESAPQKAADILEGFKS